MSLATRDCLAGPYQPPYYNRAFTQTTYVPQFGAGGNHGLQQWVDTETALVTPYFTRAPNGCSDTLEYHPDLVFDFLPTKWQQPDFRPTHFMYSSRQAVKDMCRTGANMGDPASHLACQYYNVPESWQKGENNALQNIFQDRYI